MEAIQYGLIRYIFTVPQSLIFILSIRLYPFVGFVTLIYKKSDWICFHKYLYIMTFSFKDYINELYLVIYPLVNLTHKIYSNNLQRGINKIVQHFPIAFLIH